MRTCKEVTDLMLEGMEGKLPWRSKLSIMLHMRACDLCKTYSKQLNYISSLLGNYFKKGHKLTEDFSQNISDAAKERIKATLS